MGLFQENVPCAGLVGGVTMEYVLIYFPSRRLTLSSPGQQEMQSVLWWGRGHTWANTMSGSAEMKAVPKCLWLFMSYHPFLSQLTAPLPSVYTDTYKTTWPPALLAQSLGNSHTAQLAETTCFPLPWLSIPTPSGPVSRIGGETQKREWGTANPKTFSKVMAGCGWLQFNAIGIYYGPKMRKV